MPLPWIDLGAIEAVTPVARWKLEETAFPLADAMGRMPLGVVGTSPSFGAAGAYPGSTCLQFAGNGGAKVSTPTYITPIHKDSWSLACWVWTATSGQNTGKTLMISQNQAFILHLGGGGGIPGQAGYVSGGFVSPAASTWRLTEDTAVLPMSTWWHYVVTWDGVTIRLYRNGVEVRSDTPGVTVPAAPDSLGIGTYPNDNNRPFTGRIDDPRVYGFALTPAQVADLYASYSDPAPTWIDNVPPVAMAAHHPLDDVGNTVSERSGNVPAGVFVGSPTKGQPGPAAGMLALALSGSSQYVSVTGNPALNALSSAWTVAIWVYPTATRVGTIAGVLCRGFSGASVSWALGYGNDAGVSGSAPNAVGIGVYAGGWYWTADPVVTPLNTWTHYAACFDSGTLRLYRNGVQVATRASTPVPVLVSTPMYVGADQGVTNHFAGRLADARVFPVVLNPDQIAALARRTAGTPAPTWVPLGAVT